MGRPQLRQCSAIVEIVQQLDHPVGPLEDCLPVHGRFAGNGGRPEQIGVGLLEASLAYRLAFGCDERSSILAPRAKNGDLSGEKVKSIRVPLALLLASDFVEQVVDGDELLGELAQSRPRVERGDRCVELSERPVLHLQVGVQPGGELVEDGFDCRPDGGGPVGEGVVLIGEAV